MVRSVLAVAVVAAVLAGSASPSTALSGLPPETHPDVVAVRLDSGVVHTSLVANDVDPEGERLEYCGTASPGEPGALPPGLAIAATTKDSYVYASGIAPGSYAVRYVACDSTGLSYGDVTVTVLPAVTSALTVDRAPRRGRVVVTNAHDEPARFVWGAARHRHRDGVVVVPAHAAVTIRVERRSVLWVAVLSSGYGVGGQRHIRLPRSAPPLPPGLGTTDNPLGAAVKTRWAKRELQPFS